MLALGLNIVVGFAGLLDLGYIAFFAVGAYVYALLASPHFDVHLPLWVLLPLGATVAAFFGVLLGAPTLRLRGDYLAIVTLGFGEIIRIFLTNLNAPINITNGPQGINRIDPVTIDGVSLRQDQCAHGRVVSRHASALLPVRRAHCARSFSFACGWRIRASAAPGWRSARTRSPPRRWASTRATSSCSRSPWARPSAAWPAACSPASRASSARRASSLWESIMVLCMVVLGGMGHVAGVVLGALLLAVVAGSVAPHRVAAAAAAVRQSASSIRRSCACCCSASRWS